ncbi:MAG: hypothetical protein FJ276_26140 [Planctomycetes bacterium]|nr:hypothetical protein [Planctomycetota bacterium]
MLVTGCWMLVAGCSTSSILMPDGTRASNTRVLWASTDFVAELPGTNGTLKLSLKSSNSHAEGIAATAEGVARGILTSQGR